MTRPPERGGGAVEPILTGFDRDEALRYMAWRGGPVPAALSAQVERCRQLLVHAVRPRTVWRLFQLRPDGTLAGTDFRPAGRAIRAHLAGCGQVILMAATLGAEADALLRRTQVEDMALAVVLDACAGAAVERVCDELCAHMARAVAPRSLTGRFSPGYGDMPLAQQEDLCRLLDVGRRIGVSLTPGGLMLPQKTVTALLGVSDTPRPRRGGGCAGCAERENCLIRGEGGSCGK